MDNIEQALGGRSIQLIPLRKVEQILGIRKSTIYHQIAEGKLPKPIKIGASARWPRHEIEGAALLLVAQRDDAAAS